MAASVEAAVLLLCTIPLASSTWMLSRLGRSLRRQPQLQHQSRQCWAAWQARQPRGQPGLRSDFVGALRANTLSVLDENSTLRRALLLAWQPRRCATPSEPSATSKRRRN